jgi:uncharacterized FlaG/YvyC family protein
MDIKSLSNSGQVYPPAVDTQKPTWRVENQDLIRSVNSINPTELFGEGTEMTFDMDPQSKRVVVKILNRQTQEVVAQLPAQYVLDLARQTSENPSGSSASNYF